MHIQVEWLDAFVTSVPTLRNNEINIVFVPTCLNKKLPHFETLCMCSSSRVGKYCA